MPLQERRERIDRNDKKLNISKQCELFSIHRSGLYYSPVAEKEENFGTTGIIMKS
jgi:putative transposase